MEEGKRGVGEDGQDGKMGDMYEKEIRGEWKGGKGENGRRGKNLLGYYNFWGPSLKTDLCATKCM